MTQNIPQGWFLAVHSYAKTKEGIGSKALLTAAAADSGSAARLPQE